MTLCIISRVPASLHRRMSTTATWVATQPLASEKQQNNVSRESTPFNYINETRSTDHGPNTIKTPAQEHIQSRLPTSISAPATIQSALILHAVKEKYALVSDHAVPSIIHQDEILIKISVIGLNPIDWKAPYVLPRPPPSIEYILINTLNLGHSTLASPVFRGSLAAIWPVQLFKPPPHHQTRVSKSATSCSCHQQTTEISAKPHFKNTPSQHTITQLKSQRQCQSTLVRRLVLHM